MRPNLAAAVLVVAASGMLSATTAMAAQYRPFTQGEFAAAQAANRPILIDVFATWCPTCKAQEPIIQQLSRSPKFDRLIVFKLNFDTQKPAWRQLKVSRQSTLIAYRGRLETARSVGETEPTALQAVLDSTVR